MGLPATSDPPTSVLGVPLLLRNAGTRRFSMVSNKPKAKTHAFSMVVSPRKAITQAFPVVSEQTLHQNCRNTTPPDAPDLRGSCPRKDQNHIQNIYYGLSGCLEPSETHIICTIFFARSQLSTRILGVVYTLESDKTCGVVAGLAPHFNG